MVYDACQVHVFEATHDLVEEVLYELILKQLGGKKAL
jgi:hypothetical protein